MVDMIFPNINWRGHSMQLLIGCLIALILLKYGSCQQCFTRQDCKGTSFPAANAKDCCVGTNEGMSYSDGHDCIVEQCVVHGFSNVLYTVTEGEELDVTFQINVKGTSRFYRLSFNGNLLTKNDTASLSDYQHLLISIRGITSNVSFSLDTIDDAIALENNEQVILIYAPEPPELIDLIEEAGEFIRNTAPVIIKDNDKLEINFEKTDYSVGEDGVLTTPIKVHFTPTQYAFNLTLSSVSIDMIENFDVNDFVDSSIITETFRATLDMDFTNESVTFELHRTEYDEPNTFQLPLDSSFQIIDDSVNENMESFALVAEVELPDNETLCFKISVSDTMCHGRVGATQINVIDNDDQTFIGFNQRRQTVSESNGDLESDGYYLTLLIHSIGSERRDFPVLVRVITSNSTVEATNIQFDTSYDALFGSRTNTDDPIEEIIIIEAGETEYELTTYIRSDFLPEDLECYTLLLSGIDTLGYRDISVCNQDYTNSTDYFCQHTICIKDDDEPFVVAFVNTAYTVLESEGEVEVCVNLTQPQKDILDETISLNVYDNPSSFYIPSTAILALPDSPNFLGVYTMAPMTDYEQQTQTNNHMRATPITETSRVICYKQIVYDDRQVEPMEYIGLSMNIRESTALTIVNSIYGQTSIKIIDNNDMAVVCLENTVYHDTDDDGIVEVCAVVDEPNIDCPVAFPFSVTLSTSNGSNPVLFFAACEKRSCVSIGVGSFSVHLERTPGLDSRINLCDDIGTLFNVVLEFEQALYSVKENVGSVAVCVVATGMIAAEEITLYTEEDDTALSGVDYHFIENTTLISHRLCIDILIIDDYLPGSAVQFSLIATSRTHRIPTTTSTVVIMDDEIEKGCTYELINASIAEETERDEVVVEIVTVLDSVLTTSLGDVLGGETSTGNVTSGESPLQTVYNAVAEEYEVEVSDEGFRNFTEAITEITEAKKAACEGGNISEADIPRLVSEYDAIKDDIKSNIEEARDIFGKMLCLSERDHDRKRRRRSSHCPEFGEECLCPSSGAIVCVCEFFACLDPDDEIKPIFGLIDVFVPEGFPCLALAVDTTGSMGDEIDAVKEVVRNFIASGEDGPGCYVLQPFNDLINGAFDPGSIPPATIATTYNGIDSVIELQNFRDETEDLYAYNGGDTPERQFRTLLTILDLLDSDGFLVMIPGSEIVLLTDATSHDSELEAEVISKARDRQVCISFYLSYTEWEPYYRISEQTGGAIVDSIDRSSFLTFDENHEYGQCASFHDIPTFGKRKKRQVSSSSYSIEQRCHYFTTSLLTTQLTVYGYTTEAAMIVTDQNGLETRVITNIAGEKLYRKSFPGNGPWSVCVETGTLTISIEKTDDINSILQFIKPLEESPELTLNHFPPPACTEGNVTLETTHIDDIGSVSIELVDDESGEILSSAPLYRCANRLIGSVPLLPQASVRYRTVGNDVNGQPFDSLSTKTVHFVQDPGANFDLEIIYGGNPIEFEHGQTISLNLTVHNHDLIDAHYTFSFEPVATFVQAFRPVDLILPPGGRGSVNMIAIPRDTEPGLYTFTATVTDGCVIHSISKDVLIQEPATTVPPPDTNECGCMNGGTCVIRIIRGRRILRCACPTGFTGSLCETPSE